MSGYRELAIDTLIFSPKRIKARICRAIAVMPSLTIQRVAAFVVRCAWPGFRSV